MGTIGPGTTLTTGVQDIAALLPLLGTEQCEDHVGSALTKGFLYAAATPLSIFGSLGLARAGMKTLVAAFVIRLGKWEVCGARILANMGFKPQGTNLSLIMIDEGDKDEHYLLKRRLQELFRELHIESLRGSEIEVSCPRRAEWNIWMTIFTFVSCLLSITPYVYINIHGNILLDQQARWTFPVLRAVGGCLTTTLMQLVIQTRIMTLTEKWLEHKHVNSKTSGQHDVEKGSDQKTISTPSRNRNKLPAGGIPDDGNSILTWCWLVLLLGGILAVVVGYIGCFSIVQSAETLGGPISWLCLEAGLSIIRMILWGLNPERDDAPRLQLVLPLENHAPLPTCMKYEDEIQEAKVLPLTRASEFLESTTSFIGLIDHFSHPDLTLYYTLTRKNVVDAEDQTAKAPKDRVLYITIFHHKERTTRVYTEDQFYSTAGGLGIDLEHNQLETTLGEPIDRKHDPVAADPNILRMLLRHYRSIINGINSVANETTIIQYTITNKWTMQAKDTKGSKESSTTKKSGDPYKDDCRFLEQGRLERMRRTLISVRGRWIEDYMKWVVEETERSVPIGFDLPYRMIDTSPKVGRHNGSEEERRELKGGDLDGEKAATEILLMNERYHMEILLVEEVRRWEQQLLQEMQIFHDDLDREPAKKHLVSTWSRSCWRRLDTEIRAMDARMNTEKNEKDPRRAQASVLVERWDENHRRICQAWGLLVKDFVGTSRLEDLPAPTPQLTTLKENLASELKYTDQELDTKLWQSLSERPKIRCRERRKDVVVRLGKEAEAIEMRLQRGLEYCNEFWSSLQVVAFRHSRPKWRVLRKDVFKDYENLKKYLHVLNGSSDVVHLNCWSFDQADVDWIFERIRDMSVTSIHFHGVEGPKCPSIENNNNLISVTGDIVQTPGIKKVLERNGSQSKQIVISLFINLFSTDMVHDNHEVECNSGRRATISISGPTSGNIILRLVHYTDYPNTTVTVSHGQFELTLSIPQGSWTTDDITLHPYLSFQPDERNELTLSVNAKRPFYRIRDIQLWNDPCT